MFIYGIRSVHLKSAKSRVGVCPKCGTKGALTINVLRRHFHIFWIPMFPLGKKGFAECGNCKEVIKHRKFSDNLKLDYQNLKANAKGPTWQYTGLFVVLFLIFSITVFLELTDESYKKEKELKITNPKVGDVYDCKIDILRYSTYKVVKVSKDSIYLSVNKKHTPNPLKLHKVRLNPDYSNKIEAFSLKQHKEMYTKGIIMSVIRD